MRQIKKDWANLVAFRLFMVNLHKQSFRKPLFIQPEAAVKCTSLWPWKIREIEKSLDF